MEELLGKGVMRRKLCRNPLRDAQTEMSVKGPGACLVLLALTPPRTTSQSLLARARTCFLSANAQLACNSLQGHGPDPSSKATLLTHPQPEELRSFACGCTQRLHGLILPRGA